VKYSRQKLEKKFLGYNRAETAIVPSNRSANKESGSVGNGAKDTTDVIMELKYRSIFSLSDAGIYQRLAIGPTAVSQPGAALMFAKDDQGKLDSEKAKAITEALHTVPETPADVTNARAPLAKARVSLGEAKKEIFDKAAQSEGYADFRNFTLNRPSTPSLEQIKKIRSELEKDPDTKAKLAEVDRPENP
jgi:hypothetical protein